MKMNLNKKKGKAILLAVSLMFSVSVLANTPMVYANAEEGLYLTSEKTSDDSSSKALSRNVESETDEGGLLTIGEYEPSEPKPQEKEKTKEELEKEKSNDIKKLSEQARQQKIDFLRNLRNNYQNNRDNIRNDIRYEERRYNRATKNSTRRSIRNRIDNLEAQLDRLTSNYEKRQRFVEDLYSNFEREKNNNPRGAYEDFINGLNSIG